MKGYFVYLAGVIILLVSCVKETLPKLETLAPGIQGPTRLTLNGRVTDDGNSGVTGRGFCWGFSEDPSLDDNFSLNGSGPGSFTEELETDPDTEYFIRTYATNAVGTAYGNQVSVKTPGFPGGTFTDQRDSRVYQWVTIGSQDWMAENLAYLPSVSPPSEGAYTEPFYYVLGYEGRSVTESIALENYIKYGALYNWKASQTGCPAGWHMPSDEDWMVLERFLGMSESASEQTDDRVSGAVGNKLKSKTDWFENGNGSNSFGFNALPGGGRNKSGIFGSLGIQASFWTCSPTGSSGDFYRGVRYDSQGIIRGSGSHNIGLSVRCMRN